MNQKSEHVADLVAACRIGKTIAEILAVLTPNDAESKTHPAADIGVEFNRKFVRCVEFGVLTLLPNEFKARGLPEFRRRFAAPNAMSSFAVASPHPIQNVSELRGI